MANKFSVQELEAMGMDKNQINAIMSTYAVNDTEKDTGYGNVRAIEDIHKSPRYHNDECPVNCSDVMNPTSVFDLQTYAKGTLVRFPDFAEGQPFVARVRRPSMLVMAKQGKIPNTLLASANELFSKGGNGLDIDSDSMLSDFYNITEIICEAALKEPTYQQIKDAGMDLSDDQLMAIFNYTQIGVKALESFR